MISAFFRRIFYADLAGGPSLPGTVNQDDGSLFPENFEALIARRAERKCNRDREAANRFIHKHMILKEGRK
jgi:hypothetical protein